MAATVIRHLANCVEAQRFGHLLRALQVRDADLADLYYELEIRGEAPGGDGGGEDPRPVVTVGQSIDARSLIDDVLGDDADMDDAQAAGDLSPPEPVRAAVDKAGRFADAVLEHWVGDVRSLAETPRLCTFFRLSPPAMLALASELIAGAGRLGVRDEIAERVRRALSFRMKIEQARAKSALVAATILNGYVNWMGFDRLAAEERPTVGRGEARRTVFQARPDMGDRLVLPAQPAPYDQIQYADWMRAFRQLVEDNAANQDGAAIDVEQNARLGRLLDTLDRLAA
jgi:hypothetical protein